MRKLHLILILAALIIPHSIISQEKKKAEEKANPVNIVIIEEETDKAVIKLPKTRLEVLENNDTVAKLTLGQKRFEFIEDNHRTNVRMVHIPRESFKGHFAGVQLGFNNYFGPDFNSTMPEGSEFMEINAGKSMCFSINFIQYDIDLQKYKKNIGIVTGLGWTVYNYRQDNQYRITTNAEGNTIGIPIVDDNVEKSKLVTSFLNVPLLFEAQIPSTIRRSTAFISAGVYGGFRIGSHTKIVYSDKDKDKSRDNLNLNPIQYGAMFQIGYKMIKLYATCNFSTLFEKDKGPELHPYSIGVTLLNF